MMSFFVSDNSLNGQEVQITLNTSILMRWAAGFLMDGGHLLERDYWRDFFLLAKDAHVDQI